jgi:hypothetical protein
LKFDLWYYEEVFEDEAMKLAIDLKVNTGVDFSVLKNTLESFAPIFHTLDTPVDGIRAVLEIFDEVKVGVSTEEFELLCMNCQEGKHGRSNGCEISISLDNYGNARICPCTFPGCGLPLPSWHR